MPLTDVVLSAALAGSTVVVTGGGGLVGSRITARLRTAGARVIAVGKLDAYPATVYADLFGVHTTDRDTIVGDIADATLMDHVIREADYVIHAAAVADVAACTRNPMAAIQTNVTGTQVLLDAVRRCNARVRRFVFVSSAAVYGKGDPKRHDVQTWHEDRPLAPLSVYANTKAWGVPLCLWSRWSGGNVAVMSEDMPVRESAGESMRPCDFCGHPVVMDSVDERDCPVCGEAAEDQPAEAGRGS
ncbi:NAD-dependent epimerase/dehydratase family protein [Streptomyces erythrochromogenes]|uniref:NAD-dependent epimerase/dehydratase family protein n=1 Tax=Streptomyces erythrochromogenes TaxID=285574 RepID=UPI0034008E12